MAALVAASLSFPLLAQSPLSTHPRLWIRGEDLPRLRSWASDTNPIYRDGLARLVERAKQEMDSGIVPRSDGGTPGYEDYPTESYAELFAFMSLIAADQTSRDDYAARARTLLMHVMNEAAKGVADAPFRGEDFALNDRSRWTGAGFALTVDWIYPYLSAADKATVRQVFLRWADEMMRNGYAAQEHVEHVKPRPCRVAQESGERSVRIIGRIERQRHLTDVAQVRGEVVVGGPAHRDLVLQQDRVVGDAETPDAVVDHGARAARGYVGLDPRHLAPPKCCDGYRGGGTPGDQWSAGTLRDDALPAPRRSGGSPW